MIVLVQRRHALGRQLAADPVGLLGEMDAPAATSGRQCGRNPAGATPDDEDIAGDRVRRRQVADGHDDAGGIAVDGHPHDIDQSLAAALHVSPLACRRGGRCTEIELLERRGVAQRLGRPFGGNASGRQHIGALGHCQGDGGILFGQENGKPRAC